MAKSRIKPVEIDREDDDVETYKVGEAKIHIRQDHDPLNPRIDWDHPWNWYSNHRRYDFDKESYKSSKWLKLDDIMPDDFGEDEHEGETIYEAVLRNNPEFLDAHPIYLLDHSSLHVSLGSFGDPWDSGVGAVATITRKKAEEYWPDLKGDDEKLKERAYKALEEEVDEMEKYLNGDVYGFVIETQDGEGDSCWGFYDIKDALEEADSNVSMKDATLRSLGGLDIVNEMNARQHTHFHGIAWSDEVKDGEKLYTKSVSLESGCERTETYGNPDALAKQLGYQRGEFDGHSLLVWNETEEEDGVHGTAVE